jgi:hypothetical protein
MTLIIGFELDKDLRCFLAEARALILSRCTTKIPAPGPDDEQVEAPTLLRGTATHNGGGRYA